ncbi:helix-turn-helix transcriptional regulator [Kribbella deserti]|uniref:Helix-turn-helix transcriptional regulator n=1 Tax=Kribbella deserti TaxID=1926257 RepID=A0ABV6QPL8_9ACTN
MSLSVPPAADKNRAAGKTAATRTTQEATSSIQRAVVTRHEELGAFLRSRRERIQPEEVGLAPGGRRRTPGLRREEVALLAGVGVTWYTWLEQGRDINVSAQVVEAIARTLRLDRLERNHLFTLAGIPLGPFKGDCTALPASVHRLLRQVSPYPAFVVNARYDVLAYNEAYAKAIVNLDEVPVEERNIVWLAFNETEWKCRFIDADDIVLRLVAGYRAALADHLGDPAWQDFTARLLAASPRFANLWQRYDVAGPSAQLKLIGNSEVGLLRLEPANLWLSQAGKVRATVYTPADDETERRLHQLAG